jgi:hypothetical protein
MLRCVLDTTPCALGTTPYVLDTTPLVETIIGLAIEAAVIGQIKTLPNVGLQLFDVVTVTDARCGVSSEAYRVWGIEEVYDTTRDTLIFQQRVTLGAT